MIGARAGALVLGMLASGCAADPSIDRVVLISIDTLRADRIRPETTPHIEGIAARGVRFENVLSPVPLTLPAHSSLLTGTLPMLHGIHDNLGYRLPEDSTTLAELLQARDFTTGAIVSSFVLDARFNLDQGFQSYNDDFVEKHKIAFLAERKGDETTRFARAWLEANRDEKFFLFLHYYDPHDDYSPPEPFRSRFAGDPYAGEVAFADAQVGEILETLESLGLEDRTLLLITSDHGEMLEEHGEATHGYFIYQSALRVPLVIRPPGLSSPRAISEWASLVDVVPTVAGLLGIDPPEEVQGRDLSVLWREEPPRWPGRDLYSESFTANRYYGAQRLFGILAGDWKYVHTRRPELYDLRNDPGESKNLIGEEREVAEAMRARLEEILNQRAADSRATLDQETLKRLSTLGYLGSAPRDGAIALDAPGDDPKDWIAFYRRHQRLEELVNRGAFDEGRVLAQEMLEENPRFASGHLQLARIATEERDLQAARTHYESALEIDPRNAPAQFNRANVLAELGDLEGARDGYRKALEIDPQLREAEDRLARIRLQTGTPQERLSLFRRAVEENPDDAAAHHQLGLALRSAGRSDEALRHLTRAVELDPGRALAQNDMGVVLKEMGRSEEALERYRKALAVDPRLAEAHNNIGSLLGSRGLLEEGKKHFRLAVESDPTHAEARNNLGLALRMSGDRGESLGHFREALRLRPDWPRPMSEIAWILATHPDPSARNPAEAVRLAERASELTSREQPIVLDTLAAAYAADGRFEAAREAAELAATLARARAPALAAEIEQRLALYRQGRPFIESSRTRASPR